MLDRPRLEAALRTQGLARPDEEIVLDPLAGGVSCDVFRVALDSGDYCVKCALPKLRVEADWFASPRRAHVEAQWIDTAARIGVPAPALVFEDREANCFVMRFVADALVWKAELMAGRVDPGFAEALGRVLGRMHAATVGDLAVASRFANADLFEDLRIAPFILYCADRHPAHADRLRAIADLTRQSAGALIHGDFSPKNILVTDEGPVILDAECATWGDPAFDAAFCLTHLLLKARALPDSATDLVAAARRFASGHAAVAGDDPAREARTVDLVSALLLARVDGKSPAEYLDEPARADVRAAALAMLDAPPASLDAQLAAWTITEETA